MSRGRVQAPCSGTRRRRDECPGLAAAWVAVFAPLLLALSSPVAARDRDASEACNQATAGIAMAAEIDLPTLPSQPQNSAIALAAAPGLIGRLHTQERRRIAARWRAARSREDQEEHEAPAASRWFVRLFRNCGGWLLAGIMLIAAGGSAAGGERPAREFRFADNAADPPVTPVAYSRRARSTLQEGSPNSGAFDAPDVRRPYWESPNIIIEEADEYPHPRSLEVNDPSSFWYTNRPNILNIPVTDEWDFYNLINTDRPDFTDAVYSVGKGVAYLENGYTFHKIVDGQTSISTRQLPESLLRYGLTDEFELRLKWNGYLMTDFKDHAHNVHLTEFGSEDLDVAFKWELLQQQGWRPMFTVVSGLLVPSGTPGTSANAAQPHFNLLWGWGLRRWLYLKVQTGCDFVHVSNAPVSVIGSVVPGFVVERTSQASWHQSCCFLTQVTKRVGAFHEWFMIQNTGSGDTRAQHFLDMGTYIYMTPNIQFDARIGTRVSNRVQEMFTGAGFSARW